MLEEIILMKLECSMKNLQGRITKTVKSSNSLTGDISLIDIHLSNDDCTWSNINAPIFTKTDSFLVSSSW